MHDVTRLTVDDFFAWQRLVDGRYELVDGHITPHPDYVTPAGFAVPDNDHAAVCANLVGLLQAQLKPPCRVYVGAGAVVDRLNANVPDVAVSCSDADRTKAAIAEPRFVLEVSSPSTARIDTGRKVSAHLAIATLEAYFVVDRPRRAVTVYRPDAGPQTFVSGEVRVANDLTLSIDAIFA